MDSKKLLVVFLSLGLLAVPLSGFSAAENAEFSAEEGVPEHEQLLNEAREFLSQDKPQQAQVKLEKARKLAPKNSAVSKQLGEVYIITDREKAQGILTEILVSEDFRDIKRWASIRYYDLAREGEGIEAAIAKLEAEAKKNPKNLSIKKQIAEGYVCLRDWGRVVEIYEGLAKKQPDDTTVSTRLIDYQLLNGDYDAVIKKLAPKVRKNPDDKGASDILLRAYTEAGKPKEALSLYEQRVAESPGSPGLRGRYAQALEGFGFLEEAAAQWKKCFELDPSNLFFKQKEAEAYRELEDFTKARKEFGELLKIAKEKKDDRYQQIAESGLASVTK